jgi:hypothetical protein
MKAIRSCSPYGSWSYAIVLVLHYPPSLIGLYIFLIIFLYRVFKALIFFSQNPCVAGIRHDWSNNRFIYQLHISWHHSKVQKFFLQRTDLCYLSLFLPSISTLVSILSVTNAPGIWSFRREEFVLHQLDILDLILCRIWKNSANIIFCFISRWFGFVNAVYTSHYDIPNVIRTGVLINEALGIVTEGHHIIIKRYSR